MFPCPLHPLDTENGATSIYTDFPGKRFIPVFLPRSGSEFPEPQHTVSLQVAMAVLLLLQSDWAVRDWYCWGEASRRGQRANVGCPVF